MSKSARTRRRLRQRKAQRQSARRGRRIRWKPWVGWGIAAVIGVSFALVLITGSGRSTESDPAVTALARELSGGEVRVYTGSVHTVYHSADPLPTRATPNIDPRPTLVWFSGTWCPYCADLEPWVWEAASSVSDRIRFVEKSVDHDRAAAQRYGVRGTPTFVLIDAVGEEIARFFYQGSSGDFVAAVAAAVGGDAGRIDQSTSSPLQ